MRLVLGVANTAKVYLAAAKGSATAGMKKGGGVTVTGTGNRKEHVLSSFSRLSVSLPWPLLAAPNRAQLAKQERVCRVPAPASQTEQIWG